MIGLNFIYSQMGNGYWGQTEKIVNPKHVRSNMTQMGAFLKVNKDSSLIMAPIRIVLVEKVDKISSDVSYCLCKMLLVTWICSMGLRK